MTPQAVAAIYGGLVGGVLAMISVLAGMALESRLQRRGKLRCVNRLKQWCGVATRYEKQAANYRAMVVIAALVIWLTS